VARRELDLRRRQTRPRETRGGRARPLVGGGRAARPASGLRHGDAPVKCPKCNYLGFETGDRCRNCGYVHTGPEAPVVCPACAHPQAHFELFAENW